MSDPFALNRLIDEIVRRESGRLERRFGDGIVAVVEASTASVRKGDPEAAPTPGFFISPELDVQVGDHVWYFDAGGFKLILTVLNRPAVKPRAGVWSPGFTFQTPGNLALTYSERTGIYRRFGDLVFWVARLSTSAFTHTTAAGNARLTGLPFLPESPDVESVCVFSGWTKANYTQVAAVPLAGFAEAEFHATGSGQALATLAVGDIPTGGTLNIRASGLYLTGDP